MTVYVESNFVLEIALGQEQAGAAEAILESAERGAIELALPALALSEPFSTVVQRSRRIHQLRRQVEEQLRELARSQPHQADVQALTSMPALLASIERREHERLLAAIGRLYAVGIIISIDAAIYRGAMRAVAELRLSPQDAIIYAAVLDRIRSGNLTGPHYFITRNWRDFEQPEVLAELGSLHCEFLRSFDEGKSRLG